MTIEQEMKGKVAIVTGGNTGIGKGCAKVFCEAGMNVVIAARRIELGEQAAEEIKAGRDGNCVFKPCDVSKPEQVKELVDFAVDSFGRLDTMVNNARLSASSSQRMRYADRFIYGRIISKPGWCVLRM